MRKNLLALPFLLLSFFTKAQCAYPPCITCVDSSRINIYYQCYDAYLPVCGCDGKTYRSVCAAYNWGGLINAPNPFPFGDGPCGDFDFDFVPNPIIPESINNGFGTLSIYTKIAPVSVLIQFYDMYGRVWYAPNISQEVVIPQDSQSAGPWSTDVHMDDFPQGIYYLFITINGEAQKKKILKTNLH